MKESKIKILHVVGGLNYGGVECVILNYFTNMDLSKYELFIISHEEPNEECKIQFEKLGFKVYVVPSKKENIKKNIIQLYKIISEIKPDIIHSHLTLSNYAPLFIAWLCGVKHRISHSHLVYQTKSAIQKVYAFLSNIFTTHCIACSKEAGIYLFGNKKYKQGKIIVLNNAINMGKFLYDNKIRDDIRKELNIENKKVIGHVGRFHEQKNHNFLIEAFSLVHKKDDNCSLLLIGNGDLKDNIIEQIHKKGLENSVIVLPAKDNINDYYQAMDLFVFPSLYEGLGIVLIEAQISGLSCIASSNIPKEVKISPLVEFVDIEDADLWAQKIIEYNINGDRLKYKDVILNSGYDIKREAIKLDNFYNTMKGERNVK